MIFTDGAVNRAGRGSSATVLIPLEADQEVETTQIHSILTCSDRSGNGTSSRLLLVIVPEKD